MSRVTHPSIEDATYAYKGQPLQAWTETSQLSVLVKSIELEFNQKPPIPQQAHAAQNMSAQKPGQPIQAPQNPGQLQPG